MTALASCNPAVAYVPSREGPYLGFGGGVYCNGDVDQVYVTGCAEIWATGGYWHELECRDASRANDDRATVSFGRQCTSGRSYRSRARGGYFEGGWGSSETYWDYSSKVSC